MAVVDVGVVINARDNATATIGRVRTAINQLNGSGNSGLRGLNNNFNLSGRSAFSFLSRMNTVAAAGFVLYHSIRTVVVGLAEFAAESQRASQALIVTTGSVENAQRQFAQMVATFTPAGFAIENMVQNFNALRGAGLQVADANRTLEATASAISAFGGTQPQMDRAIVALSQIGSKGVAQMEELRGQLSEAVPIALAIMADRAGISIREFMANVKQGLVSSEEAIRLFTEGAEELFDGLLEAQRQTLTGAVNEMKNAMQVGLADLFQRTDLDERLVVIIHEVTDGILGFFASIDQAAIDNFFEVFDKLSDAMAAVGDVAAALSPIFTILGEAIGPLVPLILDMLRVLADFTSFILSGALFAVFKLAEGFALLSGNAEAAAQAQRAAAEAGRGVERSAGNLMGGREGGGMSRLDFLEQLSARTRQEDSAQKLIELQQRQAGFNRQATTETREQARIRERIRDLVAETNAQFQGSLLNFADNMDRVANRVADIYEIEGLTYDVRLASREALSGMTAEQVRQAEIQRSMAQGMSRDLATIQANAVATFTRAASTFRNEMADALDEIRIAQLDAFSDLVGGSVEAAALRVDLQYRRQLRTLEEQLDAARQLNARTGEEAATIAQIEAMLARSNQLRAQAVAFAEAQARAAIDEANARRDLEARQTRRAFDSSRLGQFANGTRGADLAAQIENDRQRLAESIAQLKAQLESLRVAVAESPAAQAAIDRQMASINGLIEAQGMAMQRLTESAVLSRQLWQEVGRTIEQGVGDAIYGVVTGTQSLEDVGMQMYKALTQAAIDYIVQLYIMKAVQESLGYIGSFFSGGSGSGASVNKKAKHGATMMDGIIRGPTTIQAGEAGEEAIMPLEKVGGRLGVRAVGSGGGDNYNINISAIDTLTGAQFLMANMDTIVAGMRRRENLNRGLSRTVK